MIMHIDNVKLIFRSMIEEKSYRSRVEIRSNKMRRTIVQILFEIELIFSNYWLKIILKIIDDNSFELEIDSLY